MLTRITAAEALASLDEFSTVIDVRSEGEFAADRMPAAVNWPVLSDAERHQVGTEYKQISAFTARKRGAALVMKNISRHIDREVLDQPRDWQPLVYCWRGGQRSGSFAWVLSQIGFFVRVVDGGYQAYRRAVLAALEELPGRFDYRVVCGSTGTGKSRLLRALRGAGAQVLDLEALANHRGSVLGLVPGTVQPGQKQFESRVWNELRRLDPSRPVFIESESRKVGNLRVPPALIERMRPSFRRSHGDIAQVVRTIAIDAAPRTGPAGPVDDFRAPLDEVAVFGTSELDAGMLVALPTEAADAAADPDALEQLAADGGLAARVVADDAGARLVGSAALPAGAYRIYARRGGTLHPTRRTLTVDGERQVSLG